VFVTLDDEVASAAKESRYVQLIELAQPSERMMEKSDSEVRSDGLRDCGLNLLLPHQ
jgi:hypothetical protein